MLDEERRLVSTTLTQSVVPFSLAEQDGPKCNCCRLPMEIAQPNPYDPDRLLGVCTNCGNWEIIELIGETGLACITTLPKECWQAETTRFDVMTSNSRN